MDKLVKFGNYNVATGGCVCVCVPTTKIHLKCAAESQSMIKQFRLRVRALMGCVS